MDTRPIAVYYEHPEWFRPLFAEFERRGTPYARIDASRHRYDPAETHPGFSLFLNRMSPSAFKRGGAHTILYTLNYLEHLERAGVRVVNGTLAFGYEVAKARQLSLLQSLGLGYPRARVINHPAEALAAAEGLRWPVLIKPNVGGSGAGVTRFDRREDLERAVADGRISLGLDNTALVQEFIPARDGHITRVEVLGGKFLYAIKVFLCGDSFNLCPADICQNGETGPDAGSELGPAACPVEAPKAGIRVEAYTPPAKVIAEVEAITAAAGIEVGGVEYVVDDRDGALLYYDINALSNFVADAPRVLGFDPFPRLADYLEQEAFDAAEGGAAGATAAD